MYRLKLSRREKKKLLRSKWVIVLLTVIAASVVVWLAWIRPLQNESRVSSFDDCVAKGNPVQETYPEVCLTRDGKRFVNPKQDQAHQDNLKNGAELLPPTNPELLNLDIDEWDVRVPLTENTFDLTYGYVEDGGSEYVTFTYKRLIMLDACTGDIGITLTRSANKREPPYSPSNPAPTANVDKYFYYLKHTDNVCYDLKNAEQAALVQKITGGQTLSQITASLLAKLVATPKDN